MIFDNRKKSNLRRSKILPTSLIINNLCIYTASHEVSITKWIETVIPTLLSAS